MDPRAPRFVPGAAAVAVGHSDGSGSRRRDGRNARRHKESVCQQASFDGRWAVGHGGFDEAIIMRFVICVFFARRVLVANFLAIREESVLLTQIS